MSTGSEKVLPNSSQPEDKTDTLIQHDNTTSRFAFKMDKIDNVFNVKNQNWKELDDSMMIDQNRELFDLDVFVHQMSSGNTDSPILSIHLNEKCMTELLLLGDTRVFKLV